MYKSFPVCYTIIVPREKGSKTPKENSKNLLTKFLASAIIKVSKEER
jgi:hypothetical protein